MRNVDTTAKADAVIDFQLPTAENGYTWYRKYKSGWVEQGGDVIMAASSGGTKQVSLPIAMADTNYTCSTIGRSGGTLTWWSEQDNRTTTSITVGWNYYSGQGTFVGFSWQVSGMAA